MLPEGEVMEFKYPVTRRENIVDEIHGRKIEDPYRWLENSESPEVMNWVDEQNRLSQAVLDKYRGKERGIKFTDDFIDWIEKKLKEITPPEQTQMF